MSEKYRLFKNFMHNELGITKEDIREWVEETVKIEVAKVVKESYKEFNLEKLIKEEIYKKSTYWKKGDITEEVKAKIVSQIVNQLDFDINISGKK